MSQGLDNKFVDVDEIVQISNQREVLMNSNYLGMAVSSGPILLRYRQVG